MSKIVKIQGLDILTYLRNSGVRVDDNLCATVPDEVVKEKQKSKAHRVIDILSDDKQGVLATHFPDYYNRFPEDTESHHIRQLQGAFQRFIGQILFGERKKEQHQLTKTTESPGDALGKRIDDLVCNIRGKWVKWSIDQKYTTILQDVEILLPLLQEKYRDPMLQSDADMMDEYFGDTIPDEYINFLHDILIMLCSVFNVKFEQIQQDVSLWEKNAELMNDIHHISSFLYYILGWQVFDYIQTENSSSVNYLSRGLIKGVNTLYFRVTETNAIQEKPPEKQ